jgi:hypothetical protein
MPLSTQEVYTGITNANPQKPTTPRPQNMKEPKPNFSSINYKVLLERLSAQNISTRRAAHMKCMMLGGH